MNSSDIKVFPAVGRDGTTQPDANLLTEKNITGILKSLYKRKSFVIDYDKDTKTLKCVIDGYLLEISSFEPTENKETWLGIKVLSGNSEDNRTPKYQYLIPIGYSDSNTNISLDQNSKFVGLSVLDKEDKTLTCLKIFDNKGNVPPESYLHWKDTEVLTSTNANITESFTTEDLTSTNATITGDLTVGNKTNAANLSTNKLSVPNGSTTVSNDAILKTLYVSGTTTVNGAILNTLVSGSTTVYDSATLNTLNVSHGSTTVSDTATLKTLDVSGTTTVSDTATLKTLDVSGPTTVSNDATLGTKSNPNGLLTINAANHIVKIGTESNKFLAQQTDSSNDTTMPIIFSNKAPDIPGDSMGKSVLPFTFDWYENGSLVTHRLATPRNSQTIIDKKLILAQDQKLIGSTWANMPDNYISVPLATTDSYGVVQKAKPPYTALLIRQGALGFTTGSWRSLGGFDGMETSYYFRNVFCYKFVDVDKKDSSLNNSWDNFIDAGEKAGEPTTLPIFIIPMSRVAIMTNTSRIGTGGVIHEDSTKFLISELTKEISYNTYDFRYIEKLDTGATVSSVSFVIGTGDAQYRITTEPSSFVETIYIPNFVD